MSISTDDLRAMAKLMAEESDEPNDIRGLRARAVFYAANEIDRLTAAIADAAETLGTLTK